MEKECKKCHKTKPITDFYLRYDGTQNRRGECGSCYSKRNNLKYREYHIAFGQQYRNQNPEKISEYCRKYKEKYPVRFLLRSAKHRAKIKKLDFNLEEQDIIIPEFCPILGIKLEINKGKGPKDSSPTLDRIDNNKGYIKGNVRVISFRANSLRKDGNLEEFKKIINDLEKLGHSLS